MPIRLVSCNTGACPGNGGIPFAKHLANELGVPVYSPNAYVAPEGERFILTGTINPGDIPKWLLFRPDVYKYPLRLPKDVLQLPDEILGW